MDLTALGGCLLISGEHDDDRAETNSHRVDVCRVGGGSNHAIRLRKFDRVLVFANRLGNEQRIVVPGGGLVFTQMGRAEAFELRWLALTLLGRDDFPQRAEPNVRKLGLALISTKTKLGLAFDPGLPADLAKVLAGRVFLQLTTTFVHGVAPHRCSAVRLLQDARSMPKSDTFLQ